jgi:hypothetical protein
MKKLLIVLIAAAGGVLAAGIVCAAPAHADPNDQYLQYLISHNVVDQGPGTASSTLVQTGNNVCAGIRGGQSDQSALYQLMDAYYGMGKAQGEDIVYAAHHYPCPGA